jgi:beta-mannosidase
MTSLPSACAPLTSSPLDAGWTLTPLSEVPIAAAAVPATVPGCVHTDLLAAGLIPDPYLDDNESRLSWIGRADWSYETTFAWSDDGADRVDLVCGGLDTVATLELNGVELGRTENMHRSYRFDLRPALAEGDNTLRVRFDSAYDYAERWRERLGERPNAYEEPFNFIRKMACNFGWDWGPTLVTAGIWRPITVQSWSIARLSRVRPLVTVADGNGLVEVRVDLERSRESAVRLTAQVDGVTATAEVPAGAREAVLSLRVPRPSLWWPRGYGEQPLSELTVRLADTDGTPLDTWSRRIGFRSVRLDTTPDEHGTPYTLVVNDQPVFARGVNWIPDDCFVTRVGPDRYRERLTQACEAGVNYVRVWGGGIYETDAFYDLTDELGLLVGQDFLFACAAYPEEGPFPAEVAAEAEDNVSRLCGRASLVTWTGNNENIWGFADWDWREPLAGRSWGAGYYHGVLPGVVARLDPTVPYWPGSPYSGSEEQHPNDPAHGTMHIWDVWNTDDYTRYRAYRPRFAAEFGYQAPPAHATLRRALSDADLAPDSPGMAHHQKAADGDAKLRRGLDAHLPEPRDFADWHYLTQVNQARAITLGVEHFRSLSPLCAGTIVWQLNDCWPVTSWSAIDGDGRRKPLWYALRRAYADRLLTIQPREGSLALVAVNDSGREWSATVPVRRLDLSGRPLAAAECAVRVPARSAVTVPLPAEVAVAGDARGELLVADAGPRRAWWFFAEDRDAAFAPARYTAHTEPVPDGVRVTVTAGTLLRDLVLFADRVDPDAVVDEALVTLLPGESAVFTVRTRADAAADSWIRPPVLRCVNDIG